MFRGPIKSMLSGRVGVWEMPTPTRDSQVQGLLRAHADAPPPSSAVDTATKEGEKTDVFFQYTPRFYISTHEHEYTRCGGKQRAHTKHTENAAFINTREQHKARQQCVARAQMEINETNKAHRTQKTAQRTVYGFLPRCCYLSRVWLHHVRTTTHNYMRSLRFHVFQPLEVLPQQCMPPADRILTLGGR